MKRVREEGKGKEKKKESEQNTTLTKRARAKARSEKKKRDYESAAEFSNTPFFTRRESVTSLRIAMHAKSEKNLPYRGLKGGKGATLIDASFSIEGAT